MEKQEGVFLGNNSDDVYASLIVCLVSCVYFFIYCYNYSLKKISIQSMPV